LHASKITLLMSDFPGVVKELKSYHLLMFDKSLVWIGIFYQFQLSFLQNLQLTTTKNGFVWN
jgi:hypothetical protein